MPPDGKLCLLVEDDTLVRWVTTEYLEFRGFRVLAASNADEAIGLLETHADIRIMITDVDMPGTMDGLRLAAAVRDRWPPIEIIVTSGKGIPKEIDLPPRGVFLPKPYDDQRLGDAIARFSFP